MMMLLLLVMLMNFFCVSDVVGDREVGSLKTVSRARRDVPGFRVGARGFHADPTPQNRTSLQMLLVTSCASFSAFSLPEQLVAPS